MNSKTLSIYATIMAVVLVTGVTSISASPVYAYNGGGDEEIEIEMTNEDCEEALCVNFGLNLIDNAIAVAVGNSNAAAAQSD